MAQEALLDDDEAPFYAPELASTPEADEASMLRGEADIAAGRFISHEAVKRWVLSLGKDDPLPRPKCGE